MTAYIIVALVNLSSIMARLDVVTAGNPGTIHYARVIEPVAVGYPYRLLQIDGRAESVLTPEEWASRLATMPTEFARPIPTP